MSGAASTPKRHSARFSRVFSDFPLSSPRKEDQQNTNIKVLCRFKPLTGSEKGTEEITEFLNQESVSVHGTDYSNTFTFDSVFNPPCSQLHIYNHSVRDTLDDFFKGYNGTILAYGQTGSGKSYTMFGPSLTDTESMGVIPRIITDIFSHMGLAPSDIEYTLAVSYLEVYMEQIKDLLNPYPNPPQQYTIYEDKDNGVQIKGLSQAFVSSRDEFYQVLKEGGKNRAVSSTNMNYASSRSHAIIQVKLNQKNIVSGSVKKSNLFLVDLAGSEKVIKTGALGHSLEEAKKINSSLSVLGLVINALTDGKASHVPYRDSKLTRILQESLGGNSRTTLIINCSSSSLHKLETLSTLRFGSRAKNIKNTVHVNTEISPEQLKQRILSLEELDEQNKEYIRILEAELYGYRNNGVNPVTSSPKYKRISSPRTPSRIPLPPAVDRPFSPFSEELERRDKMISDLEATILSMKMESLKTNHEDELKLFKLESALHKLSDKLNEVEMININLRKHLLVSEKIIEARETKIDKLKSVIREQHMQVERENVGFEAKLDSIKHKLDQVRNSDSVVVIDEGSETSFAHNKSISQFLTDEDVLAENTNICNTARVGSPHSPKIGLNLRIVKPIRGGLQEN